MQDLECVLDSCFATKTIHSLNLILEEPVTYSLKKSQQITTTNFDILIPSSKKMDVMSAAYVKCNGDLNMGVLWYMLRNESLSLAKKLLGDFRLNECDELVNSSISEIGNILTASIVNAINDGRGCKIRSSVPGFATESLNVLLEGAVTDLGDKSDTAIVSSVEFRGIHSGIKIHAFLIQDPKETKALLY